MGVFKRPLIMFKIFCLFVCFFTVIHECYCSNKIIQSVSKRMKLVHKYMYLVSYQSGINALSVAILIILIAFVNQELCYVSSDEAKSRLFYFLYSS